MNMRCFKIKIILGLFLAAVLIYSVCGQAVFAAQNEAQEDENLKTVRV